MQRTETKTGRRKKEKSPRATSRTSPRPDSIQELAQRIVDVTVGRDEEGALELYAENVESTEAGAAATTGIGAIREKFAAWHESIGDATWRPIHISTDRNTIMIEWAARITFIATGRPVDFREVAVHETENGKIVRERFYYDRALLTP